MTKTAETIFRELKARLSKAVPEAELRYKAELAQEILRLKEERNAIILAHNYMEPALYYSVPDFRGDSLELSRKAAQTHKDIIIFCGVKFMAETAKILNPTKTVLIPSPKAGCSLAESITAEDVRNLRKQFPGVPVVTYINTYAEVKAESDVCCTSGNAKAVVESFGDQPVIFLPDEFLAANTARETGRPIIFPTRTPPPPLTKSEHLNYRMIGWKGKCEVHEKFTVQDVQNARKQFPDVIVLAHPECPPDVVQVSDFSSSTSHMVRFVAQSKARHFLLLTECGMADNIAAENPDKEILRICSLRCPHMNEITLEDTLNALKHTRYVVDVPEDIRRKAFKAVERMLAIG